VRCGVDHVESSKHSTINGETDVISSRDECDGCAAAGVYPSSHLRCAVSPTTYERLACIRTAFSIIGNGPHFFISVSVRSLSHMTQSIRRIKYNTANLSVTSTRFKRSRVQDHDVTIETQATHRFHSLSRGRLHAFSKVYLGLILFLRIFVVWFKWRMNEFP